MTHVPQEPVQIGRYELVLPLGEGPLGELWAGAAIDGPEMGRVVNLRRIRFGGTNRAARRSSVRAAEIARSLRHPKVAAVLDVIERDDELVVVSEHVDGESLGALMKLAIAAKSPTPPGTAVTMVRDATDALIATRDHFAKESGAPTPLGAVTPDGLVVAAFGETMLTEPGLLAALGDARLRAAALPYRAPEQLDPAAEVDERADVYALGVLLWELLTNRPLFRSRASAEAEASAELRKLVLSETIPVLGSLPRQGAPLPASLAVLVSRALMRDPARRIASLPALREAFDQLPRDLVAPPERVAATLERLARHTLEARRAALTQVTDGRLSLSPESTRSTARPPGPEAPMAVVVPALARGPDLPVGGFATQEAPTKPRRLPTPVSSPAAFPMAKPGPVAPGPAAPEPAKGDDSTRERASSSTDVSVSADAVPPSGLPASRSRRLAPLIVIAVGVSGIVIAFLARSGESLRAPPATASPSASAAPLAVEAPTPEAGPTAAVTAEPAPLATDSAAPAASASAAPPARPRDDRARPAKPKEPGSFRPKGI